MTDLLKPIVASLEIDYSTSELLQKVHDFYEFAPNAIVSLSPFSETTVHADWPERLAPLLDDARLTVRMTSDFARTFSDGELLTLNKLQRVQIRIDSSSPELMEKQHHADVRTIIANVVRLRQTMLETHKKTELHFNCTLTGDNITHLGGLARLAFLLQVDVLNIDETIEHLTDDEARLLALSITDAAVALDGTATKIVLEPGLKEKLEPVVRATHEARPVSAATFRSSAGGATVCSPCLQPWDTVIVRATGEVRLCHGPLQPVGNLYDDSLINIVNGAAARGLRASLLDDGPDLPCRTCRFATSHTPAAFQESVRRTQEQYDAAVGIYPAARTTGLNYDAEHGIRTEEWLRLDDLDPEAIDPTALKHAVHYQASPLDDLDRLLDAAPLKPETTTLVDIGAGMGRVVLHAARRPFRKIIGIELSPALVKVAEANLTAYNGPRACADIEIVCADATNYAFPSGDLVVYLFNPFTAPILRIVIDRLSAHDGDVVVAMNTPIDAAVIDEHPGFVALAEFPRFDRRHVCRLWRLRR